MPKPRPDQPFYPQFCPPSYPHLSLDQAKKILVAPLNWGLGHATRCIPVIRELQRQGASVILASDGRALELLKEEFPELPAYELPGYGIQYQSEDMVKNLCRQMPHILRTLLAERQAVGQLVEKHQVSGIITDNRFGCRNSRVRSIFITHQVNMIVPGRWLEQLVRWGNRFFIGRFDECWIPDVAAEPNLSGVLGHGMNSRGFRYIGALSRMEHFAVEKKYDLIAVISGPEPQRSVFEDMFVAQARELPLRILMVQGKTEQLHHSFIGHIECISHMPSRSLNQAILASGVFVGRSGYSSIMDLAKLGTPAIFVPTPGQTEQEYLAENFHHQGLCLMQKQGDFNLAQALAGIGSFKGIAGTFFDPNSLSKAIFDFLQAI